MKHSREILTGLLVGSLIQAGCLEQRSTAIDPPDSPLLNTPNSNHFSRDTRTLELRLPIILSEELSIGDNLSLPEQTVSALNPPSPLYTGTLTPEPNYLYKPEQSISWTDYREWAREKLIAFWNLTAPQRNLLKESVQVFIGQCDAIRDRQIGMRIMDSFEFSDEVDVLAWALQAESCDEKGRRWDVAEATVEGYRRCPENVNSIRQLVQSYDEGGIDIQDRDEVLQRLSEISPENGCQVN